MRVLICGAGAIGCSIAYFLSCKGIEAVVIESTGTGSAASGKSGGFLALDWCDGTPLESLARRSFALHAALAETIEGDWGYRRLTTYGGYASPQNQRELGNASDRAWLSDRVRLRRTLGTVETTAQVHPASFTSAMMRAARAQGAQWLQGRVTGIVRRRDGNSVEGVEVDGEAIGGDAVVIAMGPWSMLATRWLQLPPVFGLKGHSLVFETSTPLPPEALFLEYREANGAIQSPEVFPRADGSTYVCAISSETPLPIDPADVGPDPGAIERLETMCREISPALASATIIARQACYRPIARDGLPLLGEIPGLAGAYVATGHSVWGILNAPATGEAIAELIAAGASRSVDLAPFDPGRFRPADRGKRTDRPC